MTTPSTPLTDSLPFEDLYRAFWPRIFGYVRGQVQGRADAEDVTADVFLRAYQAYPRFELRHGNPAPWLFTIARHACLDHHRRLAMRERAARALSETIPPADPVAIAERRLEWSQLQQQATRLPVRQQKAVGLFHGRGLSFKEAAARMGCTEDAAKMLCHRGLKALRPSVHPAA